MPPSRPVLQQEIFRALLNQTKQDDPDSVVAITKLAAELAKAIDKYVMQIGKWLLFIIKEETIMEQKKFIQVLRKVVKDEVRSVIKEELTHILQEGLQSTVNEIKGKQTAGKQIAKPPIVKPKHNMFKENKFSDILNETGALKENSPKVSSYASLMSEDISMTSADAMNFGMQRKMSMNTQPVITDAETGQAVEVQDPAIANAMTRDYSALMKAIDKRKNK